MKDKKVIAVTGANGYIGKHVVDALIEAGAEVIAIDVVTNEINAKAKVIEMDVFSSNKDVYKLIGEPDACLHLAWKDGFFHNSDAHMEFLSKHYEFARRLKEAGLKQIAVMGTMHEIGFYEGVVDEYTPCNPMTLYGIAKDSLRRSLLLMGRNNDFIVQWLRAFYIYGDDRRNHSIFTKILKAEENGEKTFPFTSGKNKYDFVHVDDLARMISACVMQKDINGIINCCTGKPISLAEKVEGFLRSGGLRIKLAYGVYPDRPYDSPGIWGDAGKINEVMKNSQKKT